MKGLQAGECAEAYVYFRLLSWGYNVHFASGINSPFDLWVHHANKIIRIQVKGTTYADGRANYNFSTNKGSHSKRSYCRQDYDILALVALPVERAFFTDEIPGIKKQITIAKFDDQWERRTWERSLDRHLANAV